MELSETLSVKRYGRIAALAVVAAASPAACSTENREVIGRKRADLGMRVTLGSPWNKSPLHSAGDASGLDRGAQALAM